MSENKKRKNLTLEEKEVADEVADEILTVEEEEDRRYFMLILLLLLFLIFLVSSLSFAVFDTYYNGGSDNSINVNIDAIDDEDDKDEDDKDKDDDTEDVVVPIVPSGSQIDSGNVLFSYNSGSNYIKMDNVLPTADSVGKSLSGDKQYFDFNVSSEFNGNAKGTMYYEISIVPMNGNTIPDEDVRVYLTEEGKAVSVLNLDVSNFSDLPDSSYQENGKVIYRKSVTRDETTDFIFRMWLSSEAEVSLDTKTFSCKIAVDAYYK